MHYTARMDEFMNVPASKLPVIQPPATRERTERIMKEFEDGWDFLAGLKRTVTFFGSARFDEGSTWYRAAERLAGLLAGEGFTVVTGGGPGIMEAANKGARDAGAPSVGLNIKLEHEQRTNKYVGEALAFHYFFTRKVMLSYAAQAYVYFPGGFGTLDEFFEIITLIQTKKMPATIPVLLMGKDFWQPLLSWIERDVLGRWRAIDADDTRIYTLVETPEEAFRIIKSCPERPIAF